MKKISSLVLSAILLVMMAGCAPNTTIQVTTPDLIAQPSAPGSNPLVNQPDANGRVARIWTGLWHGIVAPVTLVLSFFNPDVRMYEVHNAGSGYDLGFLIGLALMIVLLSLIVRMRRR